MKHTALAIGTTPLPTDCSTAIMYIRGKLNYTNYVQLITAAQSLVDKNYRNLILDLIDLQSISTSGLFALYSVAAIFNGQTPPDPQDGWAALRQMKHPLESGSQTHFKLCRPQAHVCHALVRAGFHTFIPIMDRLPEVADALAADLILPKVVVKTAVF